MQDNNVWPGELAAVASLLLRAAQFADTTKTSRWQFAVEIDELCLLGASRADLRWLIWNGFIEHAVESASLRSGNRKFKVSGKYIFGTRTCFVLTPAGLRAAGALISTTAYRAGLADSKFPVVCQGENREPSLFSDAASRKPVWNADLRRLSLGPLVVKEYRRPAMNQQRVLATFQEEDWPVRIDDPLPPLQDLLPARRQHETIAALNRCQCNTVLRFSVDACGCGVRWAVIRSIAGV